MSITDTIGKIKQRTGLDHFMLIYILVLIGVAISAFGLGRLSKISSDRAEGSQVIIQGEAAAEEPAAQIDNNTLGASAIDSQSTSVSTKTSGAYVASKHGKFYYPAGCAGASRIKESNKEWFDTPAQAEMLGFSPATSCK